jgi:hypothetical protein
MLRTALALLSSLQVGLRIKESIERSIRQAIVIAVAIVILLFAAAFGLVAAYQGLVASYGFSSAGAAGIIAAALALLGLLILATLLSFARRLLRPQAPTVAAAAGEGVGLLDSVGKAMQQVSPVSLLAIAFIAGVLASRRR